jgi:hypothetical protein
MVIVGLENLLPTWEYQSQRAWSHLRCQLPDSSG